MYGWERNRRQPMPDAALFYAAVLFLLLLCGFAIGFAYQPMTSAPPIATVSLSANSTMDVEQEQPMTWQERLQDWWVEGWLQRFFVPEETETTEDSGLFWLAESVSWHLPWRLELDDTQNSNNLDSRFQPDEEGLLFWNQHKETVKDPQVAIYCTHSTETYTPFAGEPKESGKRGGVYVAATVVAETLTQKNIGVVVDDTIHDYPDWNKSYSNSLATASKLLGDYPSLKFLIDLHRDAGVSKENSTVEIDGKSAARIMLVVGSDARYEHPNWKENLALAERIGRRMEEMYPGLLRTVKVQDGRYNQHLSTNAILVEMGATENTIEEVEYASQMLAEVLASILAEENG